MKKTSTSIRLKQIMSERNLRQVDIIEACKPFCERYNIQIRKNDLSQYVSGKTEPKQDKLSILGMALNVNEVWLMGYDVPPGREDLPNEIAPAAASTLLDQIAQEHGRAASEAFGMYVQLDVEDQGEIRGEMKQMLRADKYKKDTASKMA